MNWNEKDNSVCVVGMGYVGITLAVVLADRGFNVIGIDKSKDVVSKLKEGNPHLFEPGVTELIRKYAGKRIFVRNSYPEEMPKTVVICVSTPVDMNTKRPVLDNLITASRDISNHLNDGTLIIVRSTVPVGTSRNIVLPTLRENVDNVKLAFCPERTIQGRALRELQELPQIIGGLDYESTEAAVGLFKKITSTTVIVSSLEAAEMIKLICNCHTDLIYSYGNEVALMAEKLGLDPIELIKSANLDYPRPDLSLPGFVGGGCLSKDPYILVSSFENFNHTPKLVKTARQLNESMPIHVADRVVENLKSLREDIEKVKVLINGFAYKGIPETDDVRGTPAEPFISHLKKYVDNIYGHDFMVSDDKIEAFGAIPCSLEEGFENADCVVFLNNHSSYTNLDIVNLVKKMRKPCLFIDCWRIFDSPKVRQINGLIYKGVGYE